MYRPLHRMRPASGGTAYRPSIRTLRCATPYDPRGTFDRCRIRGSGSLSKNKFFNRLVFSTRLRRRGCRSVRDDASSFRLICFFRFASSLARSVAAPLRKRSRSVRLFAYKCAHDGSLSLSTFCGQLFGRRVLQGVKSAAHVAGFDDFQPPVLPMLLSFVRLQRTYPARCMKQNLHNRLF